MSSPPPIADHQEMHHDYPLVLPIETNHGRGETRRIGPTRVTFATSSLVAIGDPLRFAIALRGTGSQPIDVVGSGRVEAVATEGVLFLVEASIDQTQITVARNGAIIREQSPCD